jgi:hypothetical protein
MRQEEQRKKMMQEWIFHPCIQSCYSLIGEFSILRLGVIRDTYIRTERPAH